MVEAAFQYRLRQPSGDDPPGGIDRLVAVIGRLHGHALAVAHGVARAQLDDQLGPIADPLPAVLELELERDAHESQDDAVYLHFCQKAGVALAPVLMVIPSAGSSSTPRMIAPAIRSSMTKMPQLRIVGWRVTPSGPRPASGIALGTTRSWIT